MVNRATRARWAEGFRFFAPDDGSAGGGNAGGGQGGNAGGGTSSDDTAGLKSALEKERAAVKELKAKVAELAPKAEGFDKLSKDYEAANKELGAYKFRDKRDAAVKTAVEAKTKDGVFDVDREKVSKLAGKLGEGLDDAKLSAEIADIVETIAAPKAKPDPTKKEEPKRGFEGQPDKGGAAPASAGTVNLTKLYRENPDAYQAHMAEERKKSVFLTS